MINFFCRLMSQWVLKSIWRGAICRKKGVRFSVRLLMMPWGLSKLRSATSMSIRRVSWFEEQGCSLGSGVNVNLDLPEGSSFGYKNHLSFYKLNTRGLAFLWATQIICNHNAKLQSKEDTFYVYKINFPVKQIAVRLLLPFDNIPNYYNLGITGILNLRQILSLNLRFWR